MNPKTFSKTAPAPTCRQLTDLILDYVNDRLQPELRHELERHLSICPDCISFLKTYRKTMALTRRFKPRQIPRAVRASTLRFLRERMRRLGALLLYVLTQLAS
jgi:anti-sigma factor RsiW